MIVSQIALTMNTYSHVAPVAEPEVAVFIAIVTRLITHPAMQPTGRANSPSYGEMGCAGSPKASGHGMW